MPNPLVRTVSRLIVFNAVVLFALSGCSATLPPPTGLLSFVEAESAARSVASSGFSLLSAQGAVSLDDGHVPENKSAEWRLTYWNHAGGYEDIVVTREGAKISGTEGPSMSPGFEDNLCTASWKLDSPAIVEAVGRSAQWAYVWDIAGQREPVAEPFDESTTTVVLSCLQGLPYWEVLTPFMKNVDHTVSSRLFLLSLEGKLAGFSGESSKGGGSMGRSGLAVGRDDFLWGSKLGTMVASDSFNTSAATRLAVRVDFDYQGLPLPGMAGTLEITDPSGQSHLLEWGTAAGETSATLVIDPVSPAAAAGRWSVVARGGQPWGVGYLRGTTCAGIPAGESARDPACAALMGLSS